MRMFKRRKKIKVSNIIVVVACLIFFLTYNLIKIYNNKINPKIIHAAEVELTKFTESFLSMNIGYDIINDDVIKDILVINKNKDDEILYVDYNLDKAYETLEVITNELYRLVNDLETGKYSGFKERNIIYDKNMLVLKVPFFISSDYALLSNLGPNIYLPVNFVGSILTNIKTKVTDYGMNNALVELYVTINLKEEILSPVTKNTLSIDYDVLIASKIINGRVPYFYGGEITSKSNALTLPIPE